MAADTAEGIGAVLPFFIQPVAPLTSCQADMLCSST